MCAKMEPLKETNDMSEKERYVWQGNIQRRLSQHRDIILPCVQALKEKFDNFCFLKIEWSNGEDSIPFENAYCKTKVNYLDEEAELPDRKVIKFKHVYDLDFVGLLFDAKYTRNGCLHSAEKLNALEKLAEFMDGKERTLFVLRKFKDEIDGNIEEWVELFGTHVLAKLAVNGDMSVDSTFMLKGSCSCGCGSYVQYEDTSMGHESVWHGTVDILLGPLAVVAARAYCKDELESFAESVDNLVTRHKVIAQTLVYAFSQKEDFVPMLLLGKKEMKIFLYDKEQDLFLESNQISLFSLNGDLHYKCIVALWLTVNFKYFSKSLADIPVKYTSDFLSTMDEKASEIYKNEIKFGNCCPDHSPSKYSNRTENIEFLSSYFLD